MALPEYLDKTPSTMFDGFIDRVAEAGVRYPDRVRAIAVARICELNGKTLTTEQQARLRPLEEAWYDSLKKGEPDYTIYDGDDYLGELWACWAIYSRGYLRSIVKDGSHTKGGLDVKAHIEALFEIERVADLGCGFGYTTAVLSELFPDAEVTGTNIEGTTQFTLALDLAEFHGFALLSELRSRSDLIFASEYFEHFQEPVAHLDEVLDQAQPYALVIANAFGPHSIGHFDLYSVGGEVVDGAGASRRFNARLRERGYEKVKTALWNQRPAIWIRV